MKILALDTAMAACSVAVIDTGHDHPLAAIHVPMEKGHAEALAPMIEDAMRLAGVTFPQLDRIAVTTGPGTFTGVRIGLAMARGLGLALSIPVIGIDTLSAIAANETERVPLLIAADARNDEIYAALFDESRRLIWGPKVTRGAEVVASLLLRTLVLGSAAPVILATSGRTDLTASRASPLPDAAAFGRMAADADAQGMPSPLYLRAPDAKPQTAPLRPLSALEILACGLEARAILAEIHQSAFDRPWAEQAFADLLAMPGASAAIASSQGEPIGFALVRQAADEAEIVTIAVKPAMQRRGVARALLHNEMSRLQAAGATRLFLEVAEGNAPARALYAALGFSEVGRRKRYYTKTDGTVEDAIVMQRQLDP